MKIFSIRRLLLLAAGIFGLGCFTMPALAQEGGKVQELQRVNEAQQKQLELQQKQLDGQTQLLLELQTQIESLADEKKTVQAPVEKVVTSGGGERVKLSISGQVNRAVNVVDDGEDTDAYFVDNDNSESRVRFDGTARINNDLTLGSTIELTIAPDKAGNVNQNDKEAGDVFDQRITEVILESKRFGKFSLG